MFDHGERFVYDEQPKADPATGTPLHDVVLVFDESGSLANRYLHGPAPRVHMGKQGKHITDHNHYQPGKSILVADPHELARHAGTGQSLRNVPVGQTGSREIVDFGRVIGRSIDPHTGVATSTSWGVIVYGKDGIHIF